MNQIIKVTSLSLFTLLVFSRTLGVEATDNFKRTTTSTETITSNTTGTVTVTANQGSTFSVVIPKAIDLGAAGTASYEIRINGNVSGDEVVSVVPDASFEMTQAGKTPVTAFVSQTETEAGAIELLNSKTKIITGQISATGLTAGEWSGTFNFNINLAQK